VDTASFVLDAKLTELLALLAPVARAADRGLVRELAWGPLAARVQIWPVGTPPPMPNRSPADRPLTACEADVLAVVRAAGRRITKPEIDLRLETLGRAHGDSTILRALARLVRVGQLSNAHDRRGYGVP
jgi:hypothetical protein